MAGKSFVDTNVFVCAVDGSEPARQRRAKEILRSTPGITVSTQVLNEYYVVATRQLKPPVPAEIVGATVERMARYHCVPVDADLVLRAVRAGQRWQLSHWDALLVEAARQAGCDQLLTEHLADGASYGGLQVRNPFQADAGSG